LRSARLARAITLSFQTDESFFHWLDVRSPLSAPLIMQHGDGKDLDLKECSRDQLEKECITFLNADQRK